MADQRELLELAALACGLSAQGETTHLGVFTGLSIREDDYPGGYRWNPLTDDGDCARMEAQLGIDVVWFNQFVAAAIGFSEVNDMQCNERFEYYDDKNKARRFASLRVAAEVGRKIREAQKS